MVLLKFNHQEMVVDTECTYSHKYGKNVVNTVQGAAVNIYYNVTCNPRKNQEVGTVMPRNVVSHD